MQARREEVVLPVALRGREDQPAHPALGSALAPRGAAVVARLGAKPSTRSHGP